MAKPVAYSPPEGITTHAFKSATRTHALTISCDLDPGMLERSRRYDDHVCPSTRSTGPGKASPPHLAT
eukprot:176075-Pyramimonas_sp.AAC.1